MNLNLPGYIIMQLFVNHFIAHSNAFYKLLIKSCKSENNSLKSLYVISILTIFKMRVDERQAVFREAINM